MAEEEKDIKIIPRVSKPSIEPALCCLPWKAKFMLFAAVFGSFLIMLALLTFLPLDFPLKMLGLLIGSFLLVDLHKTLKSRIHGSGII